MTTAIKCAALLVALLAPPLAPQGKDIRAGAEGALAELKASHPKVRATWRPGQSIPALVTGLRVPTRGDTPLARATDFVTRHAPLVGGAELTGANVRETGSRARVRFEQRHDGVPVADRGLVVTLDGDRVISVAGDAAPLRRVKPATIDAEKAKALAFAEIERLSGGPAPTKATVRQVVLANGDQGVAGFEVEVAHTPFKAHLVIRIDAHAGEVLGLRNRVVH